MIFPESLIGMIFEDNGMDLFDGQDYIVNISLVFASFSFGSLLTLSFYAYITLME